MHADGGKFDQGGLSDEKKVLSYRYDFRVVVVRLPRRMRPAGGPFERRVRRRAGSGGNRDLVDVQRSEGGLQSDFLRGPVRLVCHGLRL